MYHHHYTFASDGVLGSHTPGGPNRFILPRLAAHASGRHGSVHFAVYDADHIVLTALRPERDTALALLDVGDPFRLPLPLEPRASSASPCLRLGPLARNGSDLIPYRPPPRHAESPSRAPPRRLTSRGPRRDPEVPPHPQPRPLPQRRAGHLHPPPPRCPPPDRCRPRVRQDHRPRPPRPPPRRR